MTAQTTAPAEPRVDDPAWVRSPEGQAWLMERNARWSREAARARREAEREAARAERVERGA